MAKSNKERQADFREKMKKQATAGKELYAIFVKYAKYIASNPEMSTEDKLKLNELKEVLKQ